MNLKIDELLKLQPGLRRFDNVIEGIITVEIHDMGFYINNIYHIKIVVDYESPFFSEVYETKGTLKPDYIHKYPNGMLCLSTPIDLKIAESRDCSLVRFYADFIEPYFFSYEFYERFGYFPYLLLFCAFIPAFLKTAESIIGFNECNKIHMAERIILSKLDDVDYDERLSLQLQECIDERRQLEFVTHSLFYRISTIRLHKRYNKQ